MAEALLTAAMAGIRVPRPGERVHREECAFSYSGPESEGGLYICMNTFLGFGKQFVERHHLKTGQRAFLHLKRTRKAKSDDGSSGAGDPPKKKPTRLAIGVEGGFEVDSDPFELEEEVKIVILPDNVAISRESLALMAPAIRERVTASIEALLSADSASRRQDVEAWDGEVRQVSQHAVALRQPATDVRIPPCGWRCSQCDLRENLWVNLTDGSILCGRRYFDGSGGNNHALEHHKRTGFPLAVKLGTITPDGADVYSYEEDEMVLDPGLAEHLSHFGIDMMNMQKTDKTMTELELDMNQRVGEWGAIQESAVQLKPLYGPGNTGMHNLGNSCYLNAVMQVVFSINDFQNKYVGHMHKIFQDSPADPTQDFNTQVAKLGYGLLSGEYSRAPPESEEGEAENDKPEPEGISPRMFKALVGKGHPEFSTNRQQDAHEFFLHFINMVERNCRSSENPNLAFRYVAEERFHCLASSRVKYTQRVDYIMQLPVPLEAALNKEELADAERQRRTAEEQGTELPEVVRAKVPFQACLDSFSEPEQVEDFWSTALQAKSVAVKNTRFTSFPDCLVIQIKKFTFGLDWVPKKLDVSIDMPEILDLSGLRGRGLQPGEAELPDIAPPPLLTPDEPKAPVLDESLVEQVAEMGFPREACRKAVYHTNSSGLEPAINWVMAHLDQPDFSSPLVLPSTGGGHKTPDTEPPPEESVVTVTSMGFTREQALRALHATNNSVERAVDWIFSHIDEPDTEVSMEVSEGRSASGTMSETTPAGPRVRDGPGKYQLFAFISHMGTSTMCGHYVCHIKKEGRWVIYNDQKVSASERPRRDLGYIYFYQRDTG